jgi:fatty acid CoA ligase FadD9
LKSSLSGRGHRQQQIVLLLRFVRVLRALRALPDKQRQHSVLPLLDAYRKAETPLRGVPAPTDVFREAVQAAKIGAEEDIPQLSAALIDKYVSNLQLLGLI